MDNIGQGQYQTNHLAVVRITKFASMIALLRLNEVKKSKLLWNWLAEKQLDKVQSHLKQNKIA